MFEEWMKEADSFYAHIAHGDEKHRAWLKAETDAWFRHRDARHAAAELVASLPDSGMQKPEIPHLVSAVPSEGLLSARLWIDTEFNEFRGELISIAIVDEQGREFYEVLPPPLVGYGPWVARHVVPILNKAATTRVELQAKLHVFLAKYSAAHLIADWPEDIEHFLQLLIIGPGERIGPDRWTMEVRRDLPNTADTSLVPHNALEDAKALRAADLAACEAATGAVPSNENPPAVLNSDSGGPAIQVLVPREPTAHMLRAMTNCWAADPDQPDNIADARHAYAEMLIAAQAGEPK